MKDVDEIYDYLLFLKNECGLKLSLHPKIYDSVICPDRLIEFNIHENPYCIFLKTHPAVMEHCVEKQARVFEKCAGCGDCFCGTCFAGVREVVFPIRDGEKTVGFLSVGGFRAKEPESYLARLCGEFGVDGQSLSETYRTLCPDEPDVRRIRTLVTPLLRMLDLAYRKRADAQISEDDSRNRIERYLKKHVYEPFDYQKMCGQLGFSRSHISHSFKKETGKSISEYLTELRLDNAERLLRYSTLSVGEIALAVGFSNGSYFSQSFRERNGISPRKFRETAKPESGVSKEQ